MNCKGKLNLLDFGKNPTRKLSEKFSLEKLQTAELTAKSYFECCSLEHLQKIP